MRRLEAAVLAVGSLFICVALAAFDWRIGILAAGVALIAMSIDYRRPA
jgi:hypothetical protein